MRTARRGPCVGGADRLFQSWARSAGPVPDMDKLGRILAGAASLRAPGTLRPPAIARALWEAAVGSRIAARTEPIRLERGVLLVRAASAAWANELSLLGESIIEQLRAQGVALDSVRFAVGKIAPPVARPPKPPRMVALPSSPLPEELAPLVAKIEAPELRAALTRAAAQSTRRPRRALRAATTPASSRSLRRPGRAAARAETLAVGGSTGRRS
jgi:predicted nucleic acid-binding Zn ribbon protein